MRSLFSFAKSFSAAFGAFSYSLVVEMNAHRGLIPSGLEFRSALGTNICTSYQDNIGHNKYQQKGNGYKIPRNVDRAAKPICPARGKKKQG